MYEIVFNSETGNTRQLAEVILKALPEEKCVFIGEIGETALDFSERADIVFAGFWTDKGTCSEKMKTYLAGLENKKVFLFGTAGFGGSEAYFDQILDRVKPFLPESAMVIGSYMCCGKMPLGVLKRYEAMLTENPENAQAKMMVENYHHAASHPDLEDEKQLTELVQKVYNHN